MNETLRSAGQILATNGFVQDLYFKVVLDPTGWRPTRECPVCPRGAIAIAAGVDPDFMVARTGILLVPEADEAAFHEISEAERLLRRYLVVELGYRADLEASDGAVIQDWADEPERTQQEAVGACNAAAEYEDTTTPTGGQA
jgi:hypothetical protein